jgi:hypothetical protein
MIEVMKKRKEAMKKPKDVKLKRELEKMKLQEWRLSMDQLRAHYFSYYQSAKYAAEMEEKFPITLTPELKETLKILSKKQRIRYDQVTGFARYPWHYMCSGVHSSVIDTDTDKKYEDIKKRIRSSEKPVQECDAETGICQRPKYNYPTNYNPKHRDWLPITTIINRNSAKQTQYAMKQFKFNSGEFDASMFKRVNKEKYGYMFEDKDENFFKKYHLPREELHVCNPVSRTKKELIDNGCVFLHLHSVGSNFLSKSVNTFWEYMPKIKFWESRSASQGYYVQTVEVGGFEYHFAGEQGVDRSAAPRTMKLRRDLYVGTLYLGRTLFTNPLDVEKQAYNLMMFSDDQFHGDITKNYSGEYKYGFNFFRNNCGSFAQAFTNKLQTENEHPSFMFASREKFLKETKMAREWKSKSKM